MSFHDDIETIRFALTSGASRSPRPDTKILYLPAEVSEPALAALDRIAAPACGDSVTLIDPIRRTLRALIDERANRGANWGDADEALAALAVLELRVGDAERDRDEWEDCSRSWEAIAVERLQRAEGAELRESDRQSRQFSGELRYRLADNEQGWESSSGSASALAVEAVQPISAHEWAVLHATDMRVPASHAAYGHYIEGFHDALALASATKPEASPSPENRFGEAATDDQAAVPLVASTGADSPRTTPAVSPSTESAEAGEWRRLRSCVEQWPECSEGEYNPRCCRFPKSCSCTVYDPERVTDADLEPAAADPSSIEP